MKYKLLVVGSFRSNELGVVGGIARSCEELMNSEFVERFDILLLTRPSDLTLRRISVSEGALLSFAY